MSLFTAIDNRDINALLNIDINNRQVDAKTGLSALEYAVQTDFVEAVEILKEPASYYDCFNSLKIAVSNDMRHMVIELSSEINIRKALIDRENILNIAIERNYIEMTRLLIEKNADISRDASSICTAIKANRKEIFDLLIDKGSTLTELDNYFTALFCAIKEKNRRFIDILLEAEIDLNESYPSPLKTAIIHCDAEVVKLLLERGSEPDNVEHDFKYTNIDLDNYQSYHPLTVAARYNAECIEVLLDYVEDVNVNTESALKYAIIYNPTAVQTLVEAGINIDEKCESRNFADWSLQNCHFYHPLSIAVLVNSPVLEYLLSKSRKVGQAFNAAIFIKDLQLAKRILMRAKKFEIGDLISTIIKTQPENDLLKFVLDNNLERGQYTYYFTISSKIDHFNIFLDKAERKNIPGYLLDVSENLNVEICRTLLHCNRIADPMHFMQRCIKLLGNASIPIVQVFIESGIDEQDISDSVQSEYYLQKKTTLLRGLNDYNKASSIHRAFVDHMFAERRILPLIFDFIN